MVVRLRDLTSQNFTKPNGFSLPELMIAAGLSFLIVLASAYLIEGMLGQDRAMKGASTADAQLDQADFLIQRFFRTAVHVQYMPGISNIPAGKALNPANCTTATGCGWMVQSFYSDPTTGTAPSGIITLALFYRDTANITNAAGVQVSKLVPTALYYQPPTPGTYGVLYMDDGMSGNSLGPRASNVIVDHIVDLKIPGPPTVPVTDPTAIVTTVMSVGSPTPLYVRSFQIILDIRLPLYSNGSGTFSWCGAHRYASDATCRTSNMSVPFKDSERSMTITLYDNYDPAAVPSDGPSLGRIYFPR